MTEQIHETRKGNPLYVRFEEKADVIYGRKQTRHVYSMRHHNAKEYGEEASGVTSIIKNVEDTSGLMYWAMSVANKTGNAFEADRISKESITSGVETHGLIEDFIKHGFVHEGNDTFMNWYNYGDNKDAKWIDSEVLVFEEICGYGGTVDAISWEPGKKNGESGHYIIHDFKTKNTKSYNGRSNQLFQKDRCQLSAYARALRNMDSAYYPIMEGRIHYIMRDSDQIDVQSINLGYYEDMFLNSWNLHKAVSGDKYKKEKYFKVGA